MFERARSVGWVVATLAASILLSARPAEAQRAATATAGTLAADESSPKIERASCVLMLQRSARVAGMGSGTIGLADLSALTTAMTTTGLIDPAAKASLGLGPREWPKVVRIEVAPAGAQAVKLSVTVDPGPNGLKGDEPAGALLRELIERAKAVVSASAEPRRQELKARLDEIEARRGELRATIDGLRKKSREAEVPGYRGGPGSDPVAAQRRQLELELMSKRPRLRAISEILPRLMAQPDELGTALRGLVAAREALVAGLEKGVEQGKADPLELLRARADLAEARVHAAEGGRATNGPQSRNFPAEKAALEVDIAAMEAQLKALPEPRPEPARITAEDAQQARSDLLRAESESNNLETQYQQARREYEAIGSPPTLVVLDGQPR